MKKISTTYLEKRHPELSRLMCIICMLTPEYTYYEAQLQYRDLWATGGHPHIIICCPNGTIHQMYLDSEGHPFYERMAPSYKIYQTSQKGRYKYSLERADYSIPLF